MLGETLDREAIVGVPWIRWIDEREATGELRELYDDWLEANPSRSAVPDIFRCFSLRPDVLAGMLRLSYPLHFQDGFLSRRLKEMIATYVSGINRCHY